MNLDRPKKGILHILNNIFLALLVLGFTVGVGVLIGVRMDTNKMGAWGDWLGAFIAGLALVGSAYAIVIQAKHGENASWNIALARLGQIYDEAQKSETYSRVLTEEPDFSTKSSHLDPDNYSFSPEQKVWLGNLFLAYEQIYVATNSLSAESRRVWRLYLKNQLNKPTLRAAFVKDATAAKDFHNDFWTFVRGKPKKEKGVYKGFAIHPHFFENLDNIKSDQSYSNSRKLVAKPLVDEDLEFWLEVYKEPEVRMQMYAAPTSSIEELSKFLSSRRVFTVWDHTTRIGGFTITPEKDSIGTFGIVIKDQYRGLGYGHPLVNLLLSESLRLGLKTLRADVYADNFSSISLLRKHGFRKFIWLEMNLQEGSNKTMHTTE